MRVCHTGVKLLPLAALLFFLPPCLYGARALPEIPHIISTEGRQAGIWSELGMNTEYEAVLGASRWLRWDETGLYYTFLLPGNHIPEQLLVEIYIDTRMEYEEYLYEYRKGAGQFKFYLELQAGKMTSKLASSFGVNNEAQLVCQTTRSTEGLLIEGHIPWKCLPSFSPKPGATLAFDNRLRTSRKTFVGCQDMDDGVAPDNNPELFEVYRLAETDAAPVSHPARWVAEEAMENGHPILFLHWCEKWDADMSLRVDVPEMGIHENVSLSTSVAEKFLWWTARIPLDPATALQSISVTFARGSTSRTIHVPLKISNTIRQAKTRMESLADYATDEESRLMLALYWDCMLEEIRWLQTQPDGVRPVRRRYSEVDDPEEVGISLDELFALAKRTFTTAPKAGSVRAYCWTRPDGVRSPFKVYYPVSYVPEKKYPIVFHLRGYNRYVTRSHFLLKNQRDLRSYASNKSDFFVISVFGGGNNNEFCGFDELDYLVAWAGKNLNIDEGRMTLRGHSWGGTMAFYLGARMPGLFTCIDAMSAEPLHAVAGGGRRDALIDPFYIPNLRNTKVLLTVGALDRKVLVDSNKRMYQRLHDAGIDVSLNIIPGVGHGLGDALPQPSWNATDVPNKAKKISYFWTDTPVFRHAHGIEILERRTHGQPAGFDLHEMNGRASIKTSNITRLLLNNRWTFAPEKTEVDGSPVTGAATPGTVFEMNGDGAWVEAASRVSAKKSSLRPGTMMDFIGRDFVIVYGTQNPHLKPHLIERAYDIIRQVSGTSRRQWAGRVIDVVPDVEFLKNTSASRDILLLGSPSQNSATAALIGQFPQGISAMLGEFDKDRNHADARVLQAVMPVSCDPKHYCFLEAGNGPLAYTGVFLKEPFSDYALLGNHSAWRLLQKGMFNDNWELPASVAP